MDNGKTLNGKQFGAILKRQEATEKVIANLAKVLYLSELFKAGALTLDQYLEMMSRLGPQLGYDLAIGDLNAWPLGYISDQDHSDNGIVT